MTEVRFEQPAHPALRSDESLSTLIAALRERPGQWALLGKYRTFGAARQAAYEIRHGMRRPFRRGGFETLARDLFGEYRVYVRYVGGQSR